MSRFLLIFLPILVCSSDVRAQDYSVGSLTRSLGTDTTSFAIIADDAEPGKRLLVRGTVYDTDGVTPLSGVAVHVYHTDKDGKYGRDGDPQGTTRLAGNMITGEDGEYGFSTIKPAAYPGSTAPAHVHYRISVPGRSGVLWFALEFSDDPNISAERRKKEEGKGRFSSIITLLETDHGLVGEYNIKLDR